MIGSRQPIFTAVTRARQSVAVFGAVGLAAGGRPQRRTSGLRQRLAAG